MKLNNKLLYPFIFVLYTSPLFALNSDKEQPIQLKADQANIDDKKGKSIYQGSVVLTQGSLVMKADKITIYHPKKQIIKIVAVGNPTTYKQRPEGKQQTVSAQANTIEWYEEKEEIHLIKNALLKQNNNTFKGFKIIYDTKKETIKANGG
jgi:lipopolysaccharide export system protein LptA